MVGVVVVVVEVVVVVVKYRRVMNINEERKSLRLIMKLAEHTFFLHSNSPLTVYPIA